MNELDRIRDQLERAYRGDAWHGPSLREILTEVDAEMAGARPVANGHTIQELVAHMIAWEKEAAARLGGEGSDDLPPEKAWPGGAEAWAGLLDELETAHSRLVSAMGELHEDALEQPVAGHPSTAYHLLHGVIQHNLYHAGQMAILKKAM